MTAERYDIILVLNYFRSATAYLSILARFSGTQRIGLYITPMDPDLAQKNRSAQDRFVNVCQSLGAELVRDDAGPLEADLLIVQQRIYADDVACRVMDMIHAHRRVGLMNFAMAGLPAHDAFVRQFDLQRVYIPCRRFMDFLIAERGGTDVYDDVEVVQVGLPFAAHPVFPEFAVDWLVVAPTGFSFPTERYKHAFLETVLRLLSRIPAGDRIAYKPHNGHERDYFEPNGYTQIGRILQHLPGADSLLRILTRRLRGRLGKHLNCLYTATLFAAVRRRVQPMNALTAYAEFSLEAFLPGVRKGVIGGLSNTIWSTLYFGVPFFNCVDPVTRARDLDEGHRSTLLLDLNLKFFSVPYCGGDPSRGARGSDIIRPQDREGDLIAAVEGDLRRAVRTGAA